MRQRGRPIILYPLLECCVETFRPPPNYLLAGNKEKFMRIRIFVYESENLYDSKFESEMTSDSYKFS